MSHNMVTLLGAEVITGDLAIWVKCPIASVTTEARKFDAIIGNPPFIRYQNFPEASRTIAFEMMQQVGLHPTRLLNAWLPFLITYGRSYGIAGF